ncbi:MAG: hypothetical protein KDA88_23325 [Planctomycetaceae bacterium]|nr:hypothetical protein [Planctomycetaceae bacterium]MCB9954106.1 hypothetical protein [Planctomycetaceae bacterium]
MGTSIPTPVADDGTYFQILIDSKIADPTRVHLTFTANRMSLTSPAIKDITWLTGGGATYNDWTSPQLNIVDSATGVTGGPQFSKTYDILLSDLPTDASGNYRVLKIPFLNPADSSESLAGSGHLTITLDTKAVMQINAAGSGFAFALPSPDPRGAGGNTHWDFVELNCATPASNSKSVCFCNTTNVDFFSLGIAIKGRQADGTYATFGLDLSDENPVTSLVTALQHAPSEYAAGYVANDAGTFLRFLAPDMSFPSDATALDTAIDDGFTHYETNKLEFTVGTTAYEATTVNGALKFTKPQAFTIKKPTSLEAIAATGPLDVAGQPSVIQDAQKYIAAALNRGVFADTSKWVDPSTWYPSGVQSNDYSHILHEHFMVVNPQDGSACYGFSFDDVPGPPLVTSAPAIATCTSMTLVITDQ